MSRLFPIKLVLPVLAAMTLIDGAVIAQRVAAGPPDAGALHSATPTQMAAACGVTKPNGIVAGGEPSAPYSFGTRELSVGGLWKDGTVVFKPGGPGFITSDGSLGMKFGWMRGVRGLLTIEGHRLDASAPALRSQVPDGYGDLGFQGAYLIFPTPGCWEVTGHVGNASLTFITNVIKIGEGPNWHQDP
jgi:hypothetical protein